MPHRPVGRLMRHEQERREARPEAACAAETGRPLPLFSRPLQQTHGASPKGSTLPFTMQNETLGARGASPRVRSSMLSGGGAGTAGTRHPSRGNAAAHGGEGTLLAAGPREARSYSFKQPQQFHVELPHLHSQQQTLSAASRVEQA